MPTPLGMAEAYRTDFGAGGFYRRYVLRITPRDPAQGPTTIMLTRDDAAKAMYELTRGKKDAGPVPWFVDLYTCRSRATVDMLDHEPTFEELRTILDTKLRTSPGVRSDWSGPVGPCPNAGYVFPGAGADR